MLAANDTTNTHPCGYKVIANVTLLKYKKKKKQLNALGQNLNYSKREIKKKNIKEGKKEERRIYIYNIYITYIITVYI